MNPSKLLLQVSKVTYLLVLAPEGLCISHEGWHVYFFLRHSGRGVFWEQRELEKKQCWQALCRNLWSTYSLTSFHINLTALPPERFAGVFDLTLTHHSFLGGWLGAEITMLPISCVCSLICVYYNICAIIHHIYLYKLNVYSFYSSYFLFLIYCNKQLSYRNLT